nr:MAG TPA: hypothetical protein [Caudoviricetes sp.]
MVFSCLSFVPCGTFFLFFHVLLFHVEHSSSFSMFCLVREPCASHFFPHSF